MKTINKRRAALATLFCIDASHRFDLFSKASTSSPSLSPPTVMGIVLHSVGEY